jgi:hypothetical protein
MPRCYVYQRAEDLGIPVVDGRDRVQVVVTEHDVINAKKANSKHCALARAALRVPGVDAAYFFRSTAFLEYADKIVRFLLPVSVQKEIVSFDRARMFASGVYQMTPPNPARAHVALRAYVKEYNRKKKLATARAARSAVRSEASQRRALGAKIADIASRAPAPESSPEQRQFENTVAGILGTRAPTPLKPKRVRHSTQYVRGLNEPA